jgi:hypothetical protein
LAKWKTPHGLTRREKRTLRQIALAGGIPVEEVDRNLRRNPKNWSSEFLDQMVTARKIHRAALSNRGPQKQALVYVNWPLLWMILGSILFFWFLS